MYLLEGICIESIYLFIVFTKVIVQKWDEIIFVLYLRALALFSDYIIINVKACSFVDGNISGKKDSA